LSTGASTPKRDRASTPLQQDLHAAGWFVQDDRSFGTLAR